MTKKHFKAIAEALKASKPAEVTYQMYQWQRDVTAIADVCAASNPRFNRYRFVEACGGDAGKDTRRSA